jgi:hypothetical protein
MIVILPPLGKYKYDTWRILPVKCYIDNSMRLRSWIRNINTPSPIQKIISLLFGMCKSQHATNVKAQHEMRARKKYTNQSKKCMLTTICSPLALPLLTREKKT